MKTLIFAAFLFSLPVSPTARPQTTAVHEKVVQKAAQHGRWYMADTGHAVYCIGPVVTVPDRDGSLMHVATFCQGHDPVVPLHD
jgi:hypothetical protein